MTLSLRGRLETRVFLVLAPGLFGALLLGVLGPPSRVPVATRCGQTISALAVMGALGAVWELAYHGIQQLRPDRDWPSCFALSALANEAALLWVVLGALPVERGAVGPFVLRVATLWLVMWAFAQGPMRVLFIRWRLRGGRLL